MKAIPAKTEVSVTELKRSSMKVYAVGLTEGGSVSFEEGANITLRIHRPKVETWGGQASAVLSRHDARDLHRQLGEALAEPGS